jgi:hypothetical protein
MVHYCSMAILDESTLSFHTPETKQQSRQWLPNGQPGPVKAKIHAARTKHMVLAFFNNKGLFYTNYVLRRNMVNARYIGGGPWQVYEDLRKEVASDGDQGLDVPLEQRPSAHHCHHEDSIRLNHHPYVRTWHWLTTSSFPE